MPLSPPKLSPMDADEANFFDMSNDVLRILSDKKIGILGAGVGGMHTELILDSGLCGCRV